MSEAKAPILLRVDASGRSADSTSRALTDHLIAKLGASEAESEIIIRDVAEGLPFVNEEWIAANFTPADARTDAQKSVLAGSDALVEELERADIIVIGTPIYNFGIPAALKAWVDMVARAQKTFKYTETGPVGLLENKKAYIAIASGGTAVGSEIDFATGYLKHLLAFIGITDVEVFAADQQMIHGETQVDKAKAAIDAAF